MKNQQTVHGSNRPLTDQQQYSAIRNASTYTRQIKTDYRL